MMKARRISLSSGNVNCPPELTNAATVIIRKIAAAQLMPTMLICFANAASFSVSGVLLSDSARPPSDAAI